MTKNNYVIWAVIAIVFFAVGYWVSLPKNAPNTGAPVSSTVENPTAEMPNPEATSAPAVAKPKPTAPATVVVSRGRFNGSGGHTSWGGVTIERTGTTNTLRFGSDFLVTSGSDLFVYLGHTNQFEPGFKVAPLQKTTSSQTYSLASSPKDVRYYDEVIILHGPSSVPFAKAALTVVQ